MALLPDKTARKHAPGERIIRANVRLNKLARVRRRSLSSTSRQRSVNRKAGKSKRAHDVQRDEFRRASYGRRANVSFSTYAETRARRCFFRRVTLHVDVSIRRPRVVHRFYAELAEIKFPVRIECYFICMSRG